MCAVAGDAVQRNIGAGLVLHRRETRLTGVEHVDRADIRVEANGDRFIPSKRIIVTLSRSARTTAPDLLPQCCVVWRRRCVNDARVGADVETVVGCERDTERVLSGAVWQRERQHDVDGICDVVVTDFAATCAVVAKSLMAGVNDALTNQPTAPDACELFDVQRKARAHLLFVAVGSLNAHRKVVCDRHDVCARARVRIYRRVDVASDDRQSYFCIALRWIGGACDDGVRVIDVDRIR